MNKTLKRLVACLTLAVLLASMVYVAPPAQAVNEFYGDYTDAAKVYDYSSCPSMQGLAVGSTYMYTVKIGSNDTSAFISMTHKDTGATTRLYNADAGSYLFNYLGHANDMDVWGIDGYSNLFVTTTNKGSNAIVRLKRNGNNLNKVASYRLVCDGQDICATALAVKGYSNGKITFLTKWGMDLYTGSVDASLSSATIQMTKLCSISKSRVYIKGQYLDLSNFVNQGFGYYKDTLFVPITGDDTQLNRSVIMVFDLRNVATGSTIYPTESLVFRVTSGAYSALFEIESCDICPTDGKLYFNTNRRKTNSNTNHDGVSSIDGYVFETLPVDAPTSAPKFSIQYHANGGSGSMANTTVTYGIGTPLRANAFTRTGYTFTGWTAYRTAQNQWYYTNGSTTGWYAEGSQPAGYYKYIYKNGIKVAKTTGVNGDTVHMYAQWSQNTYTVTFKDEDGTTLQSGKFGYGQMPSTPTAPTKAPDSNYIYTFAGWSPAVTTVTGNATYTATYTATPVNNESNTVTGTIDAYLDRVDSASELQEGVPYIISDYRDTWYHYVLTGQVAQKVSGSKTHVGLLLSGTPSVDTTDLWYIKDGKFVYGAPDSNKYLLISTDSSSQGVVQIGSYNAANAAYATYYSSDNFIILGSKYLNLHGGTVNDVVATGYGSVGGSYWHLDRLYPAKTVKLSLESDMDTILAGGKLVLTPDVLVDGATASGYQISWSSSNSSVATVSNGTVTAVNAGNVTITATLSTANGQALAKPISISIALTVDENTVSVSATQSTSTVRANSLQTGVPYIITEWNSGAAITGTMLYTTSSGYKGLNGLQGLQTVSSYDLTNAPVWYYDGTGLRYGSTTGSYLVYNSSNQIALGNASAAGIVNKISLYSTSRQTFTMAPANATKYLNQMGGGNYNVVGLYSSAYYSQWHFNQLMPKRNLTLSVNPGSATITAGDCLTLKPTVTVDGAITSNYTVQYSSSNSSVAVVSSNGKITANGSGTAVITVTLVDANGRAMDKALSVQIPVQVIGSAGYTATAVQNAKLVAASSLKTGVPYIVTEWNSGAALSGTMVYTSSADYCGLNGLQGLKVLSTYNLDNAPVWYYDGTNLRYGSPTGSNNYLVYNSAGQVALGAASSANIFNKIVAYSTNTFTLSPAGYSTYLNQMGGAGYNAAGLYSSAYYSQWYFSQLVEEKTVNLTVTPSRTTLSIGDTSTLSAAAKVNGTAASDLQLSWTSSNNSVATVNNGIVTAVASGDVVITVTLTGADGDTFQNPITIQIPLTIA